MFVARQQYKVVHCAHRLCTLVWGDDHAIKMSRNAWRHTRDVMVTWHVTSRGHVIRDAAAWRSDLRGLNSSRERQHFMLI